MKKKTEDVPLKIEEKAFDLFTGLRYKKTSLGMRVLDFSSSFNSKVNESNMRNLIRASGLEFQITHKTLTVTLIL